MTPDDMRAESAPRAESQTPRIALHDGHPRLVVGPSPYDLVELGRVELSWLEDQSLPRGKRRMQLVYARSLVEISRERQEQIAATMGLNLDALPYQPTKESKNERVRSP
jgi:hypothetical protein